MRGDPAVINFNGGEVSPLMAGRVDYPKYNSCAQLLENYIPSILGPMRRRPGTQFVGGPKLNGFAAENNMVLIPFVASTANEFVLEVGSGYMRFWDAATRVPISDSAGTWGPGVSGTPAELATPWLSADLYTLDEHGNINGLGLQWVQSNDVMWIACRGWPTVKLSRIAQYKFAWQYMGDGVNVPTPFDDISLANTVTIGASATTGAGVTLTASSATFGNTDIGLYFYIEAPTADPIAPWTIATAYTTGNRVRSNGRNYIATNNATSGTTPPSHSIGTRPDGPTGVAWRVTDEGYGVALITGYTSPTVVTATIFNELPGALVGTPSTRWARQAWRASAGYPNAIAFFRGRLCFARDNTVWASVSQDFENFTRKTAGQVTLDMAFVGTLAADKNDRVLWMYGSTALLAGTASGEWAIGEQASAQAFGPGNAKAEKQTGYGSIQMTPVKVDQSVLYLQRGGKRLREMSFNQLAGTSGQWDSDDRSQLAEHMAPQYGFLYMAHQRQPESVVWVSSASGRLYSMTYDKKQNVYAWARHRLGGYGAFGNGPIVASMCSVKSPDGVNDDVWMLVHRFDAGIPLTTMEVLGPAQDPYSLSNWYFHDIPDTRNSNYLDCSSPALVFPGATAILVPYTSIVFGATVSAVLSGCVIPSAVVSATGMPVEATQDTRAGRVGYAYTSNYWSLPLQGQSQTGTPQGKVSRVFGITARLYNSVGFRYGITPTDLTIDRKEMRTQDMGMNDAVPLQSGDFYVTPTTAYVDQPTIFMQQDQPLPHTTLALYPKLTVEDSR